MKTLKTTTKSSSQLFPGQIFPDKACYVTKIPPTSKRDLEHIKESFLQVLHIVGTILFSNYLHLECSSATEGLRGKG